MKLSVCIPVYNVEPYIEKCVRSLFEQTYGDLEFVFIDDCSPDGSFTVLEKVLADYPQRRGQIKIVRHQRNSGLIRARQTGIEHASGEYVTHCDPDDWVDRDLYAKMMERAAATEADMVFAPMVRNEAEALNGTKSLDFSGTGADYLDSVGKIIAFNSNVNKIYRREIALDESIVVPDAIKIGEDLCRTIQTVAKCKKVVSIIGPAYHYRVNPDSMSRKFDSRRAIDDLTLVYKTAFAKMPVEAAPYLKKQILRDIVFLGLKFGVMDRLEFESWCPEFERLTAVPWPADTSFKRRAMLNVALKSYAVSRILFKILPHRGVDGL